MGVLYPFICSPFLHVCILPTLFLNVVILWRTFCYPLHTDSFWFVLDHGHTETSKAISEQPLVHRHPKLSLQVYSHLAAYKVYFDLLLVLYPTFNESSILSTSLHDPQIFLCSCNSWWFPKQQELSFLKFIFNKFMSLSQTLSDTPFYPNRQSCFIF